MQSFRKNTTSSKQPYSKRPAHVSSSGIKPREAVGQQSCNTPHIAGLIPKTRRLLALCMLPQISRGNKTRQFSSHQQSALLSLIFGRSSSAAMRTALTNQQFRNSNSQPCNLLGKAPTSSTPIVQFKPHQEATILQHSTRGRTHPELFNCWPCACCCKSVGERRLDTSHHTSSQLC